MDPRPIDFSYRRPRASNLTYQSYGLSESLFHVGAYGKNYANPPSKVGSSDHRGQELPKNNLSDLKDYSRWRIGSNQASHQKLNSSRNIQEKNMSQSAIYQSGFSENEGLNSQMNNSSFDRKSQLIDQKDSLTKWTQQLGRKQFLEGQDRVFEQQQKPYNIISLSPKKEPAAHRQYPRFSLEHRMIPRGNSSQQFLIKP